MGETRVDALPVRPQPPPQKDTRDGKIPDRLRYPHTALKKRWRDGPPLCEGRPKNPGRCPVCQRFVLFGSRHVALGHGAGS